MSSLSSSLSSSSSSPSSPSSHAATSMVGDTFRRQYLAIYQAVERKLREHGTDLFVETLRLYCARTGRLSPTEVEELVRLKQRALKTHPPAEPLLPQEALDDAFRAVILTSCAPTRAGKYLWIAKVVCRRLGKVLQRYMKKWFFRIMQGHLYPHVIICVASRTARHGKKSRQLKGRK